MKSRRAAGALAEKRETASLQNEASCFLCPVWATAVVEFIDENGGSYASASDSAKNRLRAMES
jgi:hypothetical protein